MIRVLVVGGAGVFGSRLVEGLAATTDLAVIVAGRDPGRSAAAAAAVRARYPAARIETVVLDVRTATPAELAATGAGIVVDAAGPFQGARPRLAEAAIAAGLDYLDLADARDFVAAFPALDAAARAAGVVAITGASSTPALSHAVLDALTAGWTRIDRVEAGISPGNRAPRGLSVVAAILSWAGRPVRLFLDGGWTTRPGWSDTVRRRIGDLGERRLALAETPDLDLLAARYRPRDAALFRAGLELGLLHGGLALLALLPRAGLARSLVPLAPLLRRAAAWCERFGSDRGGMIVEAAGRDGEDRPVLAAWTLVAEAGDGPSVPTLPALALVRQLAGGRGALAPGARAAAGLVGLDAVAAEASRLRIGLARSLCHPLSPVEAALGPSFAILPQAVGRAHRLGPVTRLAGMAEVEGPESLPASWLAHLFRLPAAGRQVPVRVVMRLDAAGAETWERDFGGRRFRSRLSPLGPGRLRERFAPFDFELALAATTEGLTMRLVGWRLGPLALPVGLAPASLARESVDAEGRFRFDVPIALPGIGRLVRYRGWLAPEPAPPRDGEPADDRSN
ncbi:SDR family oxidoreductase [Labrys wisconsinensis]|uniref:DUF4166 domain-containing protein n=1 Tax=Labrys wisconsinensis TaxID=425677 RepID=A0ABU0J7A0_9HYPH|nr:SDR family oxidoreductase [Labrys wisconsinensis]MDQ0469154.1 hypothetical protein [Labrys wisconsinensis]